MGILDSPYKNVYMNNQKIVIWLLFVCFLITSCGKQSIKVKQQYLDRDTSFYNLSDSSYISDVRGIVEFDDDFYFTDYNRNQCVVLDKEYKVSHILGSGGKGPGEFIGASMVNVFQDSIYIINDGKMSIEIYNKNRYISTIYPSVSGNYLKNARFIKNCNGLYFSNVNNGCSITKLSSNGEIINFGLLKQYRTEKETYIKNTKHLLVFKQNIISISNNSLNLEMYNSEGILINKLNFENIEIMKDRLKFISNKKIAENSYYELIPDAYIFNNNIYLLLTTNNGSKVETKNVLEIQIESNNFKLSRLLRLDEGWYNTFCVTKSQILAYDGKNREMVVFNLN